MMIKRIKYIRDMGVFGNYAYDSETVRDFNEKNIIYGWNYSGKTTLSRMFSYLDSKAVIDPDYAEAKYCVLLTDNNEVTNENRATSPLKIQVFNTDFINRELHFYSDENDKIEGIKFEVGKAGEIRSHIALIENRIAKVHAAKEKKCININALASIENEFTNEARRIKNDYFNSLINFNRADISKAIQSKTEDALLQYAKTSPERVSEIKNVSLMQSAKAEITVDVPTLHFNDLLANVKTILLREPKPVEDIGIASDDAEVYDWARKGLAIYSRRGNDTTCAFCGGILTPSRKQILNTFFSNEAATVKDSIDKCCKDIDEEIVTLKNMQILNISENDFNGNFGVEFKTLLKEYFPLYNNYKLLLISLKTMLEKKGKDSLFVSMAMPDVETKSFDELNNWRLKAKNLIDSNNKFIDEFESNRANCRKEYLNYLIATFLANKKYFDVKREKEKEEHYHTKADRLITELEEYKSELEDKIVSIKRGQVELNSNIQYLLGRKDISIEVTDDNYFVLHRTKKPAKHLSEGEKSAISFAYFMAQLMSLKEKKKYSADGKRTGNQLQDYIIFIDDPISSLDSNHIALVSSMINSYLFEKGEDEGEPDKVINCFEQLFVSTHNFEFYSFLKSSNNVNRRRMMNIYLLERKRENESSFANMPKELIAFKSEYIYLFSIINRYKENGCPVEDSYMMPNVVRRFLEIYTLIKMPGDNCEIDGRLNVLIGGVNELKVLHYFSHMTDLERAVKHSEIIGCMKDVITELYTLLQKDRAHFDSLMQGISAEDR